MSVAMAAEPNHHSVSAPGRLRQEDLASCDRTYALWTHLSPFLAFLAAGPFAVLAPLVLWLIRREQSAFVDDHGREVVNFCISFVILHIVLGLTGIGVILFPVLWIVGIVNVIRGAIAASQNEYFRYPITIRFIH